MIKLSDLFATEIEDFEIYIGEFFESRRPENKHWAELYKSVEYSVGNGGKRFRPVLTLLVAELFNRSNETVLPLAAAVEFIHTYSLIHDDLPCMDNDSERRGKPTNHMVFGEETALLAGDALQSLAFESLSAGAVPENSFFRIQASQLLAEAAGIDGMVGGQSIDVALLMGSKSDPEEVHLMQGMKTGALIRVSVEASAVLCGATKEEQRQLRTYAEQTGLAFQLADDILDYEPENPEASGWPAMIGLEATKEKCGQAVESAVLALSNFGPQADRLRSLAKFNLNRDF